MLKFYRIGQLEQKLLHGNHDSTDGRRRQRRRRQRRQNHNIIRPQNFLRSYKNFFTYPLCTHQNKYIKKRLSKLTWNKKVKIWALAPFEPLYLGNGKSYVKSVRILPKDILVRNLKKKKRIKIVQKINALYPEVWNYQFQPIWASSFWTGTGRPLIFNPRLCFVARIIVLKIYGNRSIWTKVITQKH